MGANKLKNRSDEDYAKDFDDPDLIEMNGGAHKSRLNQIKIYSDYADRYAKYAQDWANAHNEILNTSIDDYVNDIKIGRNIILKMLND